MPRSAQWRRCTTRADDVDVMWRPRAGLATSLRRNGGLRNQCGLVPGERCRTCQQHCARHEAIGKPCDVLAVELSATAGDATLWIAAMRSQRVAWPHVHVARLKAWWWPAGSWGARAISFPPGRPPQDGGRGPGLLAGSRAIRAASDRHFHDRQDGRGPSGGTAGTAQISLRMSGRRIDRRARGRTRRSLVDRRGFAC